MTSTCTPFFCMIAIERSASACVWEISGERLSVQLMYSARRSEKSHSDVAQSCSSISVRSAIVVSSWRGLGQLRSSRGPGFRYAARL